MILRQKLVNVDSRPRMDPKYPAGFQDVVEIPRTNEAFRVMYDHKGRFTLVNVGEAESKIKLARVQNIYTASGRVPVVVTHDGRRIRYPALNLKRGDSVVVDHRTGKITSAIKLKKDAIVMLVGGANRGRIGRAVALERHPGSFGIAHVVDEAGNEFATRITNLFVIGKNMKSIPITLPKNKGIVQNPIIEREERLMAAAQKNSGNKKKAKKH
jgi:small subunit ribosomal protein S4e